MKQSEECRAEREARAEIAAHGTSTTRRECPIARYVLALGYDNAKHIKKHKKPKEAARPEMLDDQTTA